MGFTGKGVVVTILDDGKFIFHAFNWIIKNHFSIKLKGLEHNHTDLINNYVRPFYFQYQFSRLTGK